MLLPLQKNIKEYEGFDFCMLLSFSIACGIWNYYSVGLFHDRPFWGAISFFWSFCGVVFMAMFAIELMPESWKNGWKQTFSQKGFGYFLFTIGAGISLITLAVIGFIDAIQYPADIYLAAVLVIASIACLWFFIVMPGYYMAQQMREDYRSET